QPRAAIQHAHAFITEPPRRIEIGDFGNRTALESRAGADPRLAAINTALERFEPRTNRRDHTGTCHYDSSRHQAAASKRRRHSDALLPPNAYALFRIVLGLVCRARLGT